MPTEEVQKLKQAAPKSLRMRLRDATSKASTMLKSLSLKKPVKALEKLPEKTPEQDRAVVLDRTS